MIDQCLKGLQGLGKPFKYIGALRGWADMPCRCWPPRDVTCLPLFCGCSHVYHHAKERRGALHDSNNVLGLKEGWCVTLYAPDRGHRVTVVLLRVMAGISRVPWENATMHCIVTVFGLAIAPSASSGEAI